jgi:hypothetical protein
MKKSALLVLVAVAAASFAAGAFAQDAARWIGAAPSHVSVETFEMTIGVSPGQTPRRPERFAEDREVLHLPSHYGSFVGITGNGAATVFWFRDEEGALRNAVVHDAESRLLKMASAPSVHFEAEQRARR